MPAGWIVPALRTAGLSFLFFKVVHVAIDYGGGTIERLPLAEYLIYCFNFTAYLAGPIQRFQDFDEQWSGAREPLPAEFEPHLDAALRILRGLVKKYVLATYLAPWAFLPGATIDTASVPHVVAGVYLFYLYLYLDFSGYCDIVIGTGVLLGVRPPENFNFPFLSPNVAQFWLRVHRTLTTWLTDYVFNPVLAALLRRPSWSRRTLLAVSIAMMTTMLVSGLWHGTTANFILFGLAHGVLLTVFRIYEHVMQARLGRKRFAALRRNSIYRISATVLTFATTGFAYVFFVFDITQLGILWARITGTGA
jgi:D-alanyl-lipoteichoic acid acyltransferase DltB (MBOAT superfamily)